MTEQTVEISAGEMQEGREILLQTTYVWSDYSLDFHCYIIVFSTLVVNFTVLNYTVLHSLYIQCVLEKHLTYF